MQHRNRKRWGAILIGVALLVALVFIVNPELRVLLLFVDGLGLDLVALLLVTQFRYIFHALLPATTATVGALCTLAFYVGSGAMRTLPTALPWRPFDRLLCPALFFVTYGVRC